MSEAPVAVIDVLNGLLEAELNSVFRFMEEGSPHLGRATASVRRPLHEMVETNRRHVAELSGLIDWLGGTPVPRSLRPEEQYLAFLSLKFLLPKLVSAKELTIQRYENALSALEEVEAPPAVMELVRAHLEEHRQQLAVLQKAAQDVAEKK